MSERFKVFPDFDRVMDELLDHPSFLADLEKWLKCALENDRNSADDAMFLNRIQYYAEVIAETELEVNPYE